MIYLFIKHLSGVRLRDGVSPVGLQNTLITWGMCAVWQR